MGSKQNSADPPPYEVRTSGHGINPTDQPSLSSGGSFWAPWKFLKGGRKTKNDVRARLRQMVQDMELDPDGSSNNSSGAQSNKTTAKSIKAILRGCEDACSEYSISFHTILQNQYIKGHSPLYWAIFQLSLSRPANLTNFDREALCDILSVIKSFCPHDMPLRVSSELRLACYSMSNQDAFRIFGLQRNTFPSIWGADQALLYDGSKGAVCTTDGFESDGSAFSVVIEMPSFHKDLMLTRNVGAEFVVRNRIWFLTLGYRGNDYSPSIRMGAWCATLSLKAMSTPTRLSGHLDIIQPLSEAGSSQSVESSNVTLSVSMQGKWYGPTATSCAADTPCEVPLENVPALSSLQYADSPYISKNGTLRLRLVGRLERF